MKKAILWDFDGTLSYPNTSFSTALYRAITDCGCTANQAQTLAFLEQAYPWKAPDVAYADRAGEVWWDSMFAKTSAFCLQQRISIERIPTINKRFRELLIHVDNYCLYTDAIATLQKCIALGYKNYAATNNYPEILENYQKLGLSPYFSDYIVSSHIGYDKPHPEFYAEAKHRAGNPEILYMVGDNPTADIQGGNAAGCITVAVHLCKNSEAAYYFENLADIPSILK